MRAKDENKVVNFMKSEDPIFREACFAAGFDKITKRQASKWLMKKGKAYKHFSGK